MRISCQNLDKRWSREVMTRSMRRSLREIVSLWSMGLGGLSLLVIAFGLL